MSATIITAEIRARRPHTVPSKTGTDIRIERGQTYCQLRFGDRAVFDHFRRNLRWSAFEVVEVETKADIKSGIESMLKPHLDRLEQVDVLAAELDEARAEAKELRRRIHALSRRKVGQKPAADHGATGIGALPDLGRLVDILPEVGITTVGQLAAATVEQIKVVDVPEWRGREQQAIDLAIEHITGGPVVLEDEDGDGEQGDGGEQTGPTLNQVTALKPEWLPHLAEAGIDTVAGVAAATVEQLDAIAKAKGLGPVTAQEAIDQAAALMALYTKPE